MTKRRSKASSTNADKWLFFISIAIFALVVGYAVYTVIRRNANSTSTVSTIIGSSGTNVPSGLMATLTQAPVAVPLTGELADQVRKVEQMVAACPDYTEERRTQMNQHISWLLAPNTIPQAMKLPLGNNPTGRLIEGMATYTSAEWGQHAKDPTSCLLPIGKQLNRMLVATGQSALAEFQ